MDIEIAGEQRPHGLTLDGARPRLTSRAAAGARSWVRAHGYVAVLLTVIALFGFSMRVTNVNWDKGQHLHPDERFLMIVEDNIHAPESVGQYFDTAKSPLNPYQTQGSFVYGTFPLFLNKAVAEWMDKDPNGNTHASADAFRWGLQKAGVDLRSQGGQLIFDGGYNSQLIGRVLSAIFDVFTILLVFELGRVLYGRRLGLLASALMSVSVLNIQYSHFFGSETFLVFFMTLVFYFSVRIWKYGSLWNYLFAGLAFGMALGCKLSALPIIVVPALAIVMRVWPEIEALYARALGRAVPWRAREPLPSRVGWGALITPVIGGIVALVCAGVVFRLVVPYAFNGPSVFNVFRLDLQFKDVFSVNALLHLEFLKPSHYLDLNPKYRADIDGLINLQKGADFPPNIQWINRPPYIFPLRGIFFWGYGIPLSLATAGGMVLAAVHLVRRRDFTGLLPLIWIFFLFWFIARGFTPTIRYFLPIYPTMAIMAAFGILSLWDAARDGSIAKALPARVAALRPYVRPAGQVIAAAAVVGAFVWAYAFLGVYRQDISRVQASHWISENIPPGSRLTSNEWDDGLPLNLPNIRTGGYKGVQLKPYAQDNQQKIDELVTGLDNADYVLETSNRIYDSIPRIPARYPNTILYYKYLFDGTLGFEKVAEFRNYPKVFGIEIPDQHAEESFTVYDHPPVTIWKKTSLYSHDRTMQLLRPELAAMAIPVPPKDAGQNALEFRPEVLAKQQAGGTFSDIFHPGNFVNRHPLFFWLLVMELAAFSLVPLSVAGFRGLPDRGFLLTKPLGILALSYLAYFPASHGIANFTRNEIGGGLTLMVAIGIGTGALWRNQIIAWVRERWRFILFAEAVFLLAFVAAYWVRLQNPDLWHPYNGGEKPMDLAYFTAVTKTTDLTQGPIDPWNAGGYLNYYYYGQFISATVTKLTGIVPEVSYNLVIPMFFALTAAATFSLTYNLTESTRQLMRRRPGRLPISPKGPIIAAVGAIFLVLIAGNLKAVDVLQQELTKQSPWHSSIPLIGGAVAIAGGLKEAIFSGGFRDVVFNYDWWAPSRALSASPKEVQPITEFPFWTFLFADLHAHLMAIPFAMTFAGVALAVVLNFSRLNPVGAMREHARSREISSWAIVAVLGLIVGALRWINSWDYPPFLLLGAAALLIAERAKYRSFTAKAVGIGVLKIGLMFFLSLAFFAPFAKNYSQAYAGFSQADQTSALGDYLSHFGIMLFFITGFVLFNLNRAMTRTGFVRGIFFGRAHRKTPVQTAPVMLVLGLAAAALIWAAAMHDYGVVALSAIGLIAVVLNAIRELRSPTATAPVLLFVYAMIALGLGLSGGVELLTLDGDIGRMNTVFKFYLHVWMMWGVVSAFALWYVFAVMQPQEAFMRRAGALNASLVRVPRYAFATVVVVLLALTLVYPYFGTRARIHNRFNPAQDATNDGFAFLDQGGPYQNRDDNTKQGGDHNLAYTRDGINWIRENVKGSPTTIEAIGPSYRSLGSRVSIYTGLPTVSGYGFHQIQQRAKFGPYVQKRQADVNEFYTTTDVNRARTILKEYNVEWVIVGDEERFDYPPAGLPKFDNGLNGFLEKMYENPGMQVWHVIPQDQLNASASVQAAP